VAGIYLHIPFCKSKCPYCNFFSVASIKYRDDFLAALGIEISLNQNYLKGQTVNTIYFGGGTPSLLEPHEISSILDALHRQYPVDRDAEITLEANPDDVTASKLEEWKGLGINRLSIGVQSFFDEDLRYLSRVHDGKQSEKAVRLSQEKGFVNLSVDFIYGMPVLTDQHLEKNLEMAVNMGIPHISAYSLTIEPKTAMDILIRKNKMQGPDEEKVAGQFMFVMQFLAGCSYEHYEISNFCLPGMYSKHNSAYWKGGHYLGLGPSAHSYNGNSRQWNIENMIQYTSLINSQKTYFETEELTAVQKYNEYIMTSLRTKWGISLAKIRQDFGEEIVSRFRSDVTLYISKGEIEESGGIYTLTGKGKLFADGISTGLFLDND
jgi:oxygen-independent coproporphyrinogen-3 oxidase